MTRYLRQEKGFLLLEVLVALAILSAAIVLLVQLMSADTKMVMTSEDTTMMLLKAEEKMRLILEQDQLTEGSWDETTDEGYRYVVVITEHMKERTDNLQIKLFDIALTMSRIKDAKPRSVSLKTVKMIDRFNADDKKS